MFEPEVFRKKCAVSKKVLVTLLGLFGAPAVIRHPHSDLGSGNCGPCAPPRYVPAPDIIRPG